MAAKVGMPKIKMPKMAKAAKPPKPKAMKLKKTSKVKLQQAKMPTGVV